MRLADNVLLVKAAPQATISTNCNRIFQPKISKMQSLRMELRHFGHV